MKRIFYLFCASVVVAPSAALAEKVPDPARSWNHHFNLYFWIAAAFWFFVTVLLIYFSLRYKRKKGQGDGAYIEGNTLLEIIWTIVPLVIILLLGVQTWAVYKEYRAVPKDAYEVNIEGFMWGWNVTYPEGLKTTNELRVPVGQPVKVNLTSKDVLHAFFIPEYRVQEEAIPGRTTYFWFRPTKVGETRAYCTEFCGNGHSLMLAKVIAMEKDEFSSWIKKQSEGMALLTPVEKGKKLVTDLGCLGCHTITGEKSSGPTLKGVYGRETVLADGRVVKADDEYLGHALETPNRDVVKGYAPIMPPYKLSTDDEHAIVEYLKTLK